MTYAQAKKKFNGFTRWYNKRVKPKYKNSKAVLWEFYCEQLMNNNQIELPPYETKSGCPELWW